MMIPVFPALQWPSPYFNVTLLNVGFVVILVHLTLLRQFCKVLWVHFGHRPIWTKLHRLNYLFPEKQS